MAMVSSILRGFICCGFYHSPLRPQSQGGGMKGKKYNNKIKTSFSEYFVHVAQPNAVKDPSKPFTAAYCSPSVHTRR